MRALMVVLMVAGAACASPAGDDAAEPPAEVTGPITAVARDDAGGITSFTVESGGETHEVRIDPQRDYGFDLEHLEEHRATGDPVRVTLEQRDGGLYAVEILDA